MNEKLLPTICATAVLSGCAGFEASMIPGCTTQEIAMTAEICDNPGTERNKLTINARRGLFTKTLKASPPFACVDAGGTIEVSVRPVNSGVTLVTIPDDAADTWLYSSNIHDPNSFQIHVPNTIETDRDYKYLILATNGRCLDPKFHVD